jgi:hypothetical protein
MLGSLTAGKFLVRCKKASVEGRFSSTDFSIMLTVVLFLVQSRSNKGQSLC